MIDFNGFMAVIIFGVTMTALMMLIGVACLYDIREKVLNTDDANRKFILHSVLVVALSAGIAYLAMHLN